MDTEDEKYRQMREYSRVDACVPIEVRLVPPEERKNVRSKSTVESVLTDLQALPDLEDNILSESLKILNSKLDTIINLLTFQCKDYCSLQLTHVNVSAGGLSLSLRNKFQLGDVLEIRMMFPTIPYVVFYIYGEVVRAEKDVDQLYQTSVEFTEIDEDIRDKIAKYVFEKQREILRKKRRQ